MSNKGFSLIELIVVVIIIGILAGMAIPSFNKSMENAKEREAKTTLELVYNAQKIYRIDKKDYAASFANMASYLGDPNDTAQYYDYTVAATNTTTPTGADFFTATATREGTTHGITINQAGTTSAF